MTEQNTHLDPEKRHDFVLLFDVTDGNPNGDPDAGNLPRVDPETMHGLVTDVCLKRKVRDFVQAAKEGEEKKDTEAGYEIYVQSGVVLNKQHRRAYEALKEGGEELKDEELKKPSKEKKSDVRAWMCNQFYDIRMFGAVMSTGVNCGQVRGPVQLTFGRSIEPVIPLDLSITRVAATNDENKETEMGRKAIIPYGLYRAHGFFSPKFARDTGVCPEDLKLLWRALENMWELDRSASRGYMSCRGLFVFSHDNHLGNAPAHKLFERIKVTRREGVEVTRQFSDYDLTIQQEELPEGISFKALT